MVRTVRFLLPLCFLVLYGCISVAPAPPGAGADEETGTASYYADSFEGRRTASGEVFRQSELTGAHKTLPFGSLVLVTRMETGREVVVRINDRLPSGSTRIIDLSRSAAEVLGMVRSGVARVTLAVQRRGP